LSLSVTLKGPILVPLSGIGISPTPTNATPLGATKASKTSGELKSGFWIAGILVFAGAGTESNRYPNSLSF